MIEIINLFVSIVAFVISLIVFLKVKKELTSQWLIIADMNKKIKPVEAEERPLYEPEKKKPKQKLSVDPKDLKDMIDLANNIKNKYDI